MSNRLKRAQLAPLFSRRSVGGRCRLRGVAESAAESGSPSGGTFPLPPYSESRFLPHRTAKLATSGFDACAACAPQQPPVVTCSPAHSPGTGRGDPKADLPTAPSSTASGRSYRRLSPGRSAPSRGSPADGGGARKSPGWTYRSAISSARDLLPHLPDRSRRVPARVARTWYTSKTMGHVSGIRFPPAIGLRARGHRRLPGLPRGGRGGGRYCHTHYLSRKAIAARAATVRLAAHRPAQARQTRAGCTGSGPSSTPASCRAPCAWRRLRAACHVGGPATVYFARAPGRRFSARHARGGLSHRLPLRYRQRTD